MWFLWTGSGACCQLFYLDVCYLRRATLLLTSAAATRRRFVCPSNCANRHRGRAWLAGRFPWSAGVARRSTRVSAARPQSRLIFSVFRTSKRRAASLPARLCVPPDDVAGRAAAAVAVDADDDDDDDDVAAPVYLSSFDAPSRGWFSATLARIRCLTNFGRRRRSHVVMTSRSLQARWSHGDGRTDGPPAVRSIALQSGRRRRRLACVRSLRGDSNHGTALRRGARARANRAKNCFLSAHDCWRNSSTSLLSRRKIYLLLLLLLLLLRGATCGLAE